MGGGAGWGAWGEGLGWEHGGRGWGGSMGGRGWVGAWGRGSGGSMGGGAGVGARGVGLGGWMCEVFQQEPFECTNIGFNNCLSDSILYLIRLLHNLTVQKFSV